MGFTSDLSERLIRHNQKSKGFTGSVNDWRVVYTENYKSKEEAHKRELQIKSWKSRIKIQELIQDRGSSASSEHSDSHRKWSGGRTPHRPQRKLLKKLRSFFIAIY
ncbi:GIY-YIG nuclease family protein [Flavobacterium sp. N502540]|uniref:GIY-YIG nuclease family protein n=1 Tax=Flavobacterium sp. N502540 TaxID=2986838 RepID=UPI0022252DD4|nr:GIY-YIG nuclease family protein [Flavobacterium sp. N502540]